MRNLSQILPVEDERVNAVTTSKTALIVVDVQNDFVDPEGQSLRDRCRVGGEEYQRQDRRRPF